MRLGQPIDEKQAWPKHFLSLVRELSPSYVLNTRVRGTRTECLRELIPGGVFVSHNTFCLRGTYHHCFGLALSTALPDPFLLSPLFIGGRFDHNLGIAMSFMRHVGLTPEDRRKRGMSWHDTHQWRGGTDDIVRRCTQTAEQYLLPFYLDRIKASADSVRDLLTYISGALVLPEHELRRLAGAVDPRSLDLSLYELTDPAHSWQKHPVPDRYYALLLAKSRLFVAMREIIPETLSRLEKTTKG